MKKSGLFLIEGKLKYFRKYLVINFPLEKFMTFQSVYIIETISHGAVVNALALQASDPGLDSWRCQKDLNSRACHNIMSLLFTCAHYIYRNYSITARNANYGHYPDLQVQNGKISPNRDMCPGHVFERRACYLFGKGDF